MIKKHYQKFVAWYYDHFMKGLEKVLTKHRQDLIGYASGNILEVGAGTGVNFDLYPENVQVYAIEPSVPMFKKALKKAEKYPHIQVFNIGIEEVKENKKLPDTFDTIASMLVLCTVKDETKAAQIYRDLLKSDGKLLVLEHIHASGRFYGKVQQIVNPVWRPLADGCNLTRRQDIILKNAGFEALFEEHFSLGTDWYKAVMKLKNKPYNQSY